MNRHATVHIEFSEIEEGVFRASCAELGLSADGADMEEAEAALLRLLDERTQEKGEPSAPGAIESERDTRLGWQDKEHESDRRS